MEHSARDRVLANHREQYAVRIENNTEQLVTNFFCLMESASYNASPEDLASVTRENFQVDLYSSNVIKSAEALLKIVTELKHSIMLNNYTHAGALIGDKRREYQSHTEIADKKIEELKTELTIGLQEMETSYYSSKYRENPEAKPSENQ